MAGKDIIPPVPILTAGSMTGTTTLTSSVVDIRWFDNVGIQCNWTGTPTGTFYIDVSLDYTAGQNAGNWTTIPVVPGPAPAGAAGTAYVDVIQTAAAYIRLRYTNATGTGVLNVLLMGKMI